MEAEDAATTLAPEAPATNAPDRLAPPVHTFGNLPANACANTNAPASLGAQPVAVPRAPKVYVAICTRDWMAEAHTSESVRNIGRACGVELVVRYMMNDGVARARNNHAAAFLESDCDILFFLDSDIIIEARHFNRIISALWHAMTHTGAEIRKHIVCGLYPKKQCVLDWVVNYLPGEVPDKDGYMRVKHAGTGAFGITRTMLLDFIAKNPAIEYRGDPSPDAKRWDLFPMHATGPDAPEGQIERLRALLATPDATIDAVRAALVPTGKPGHYDSEDWKFCNRARASGWDVWIDTQSQLRHVGKIVYPLQFTLSDDDVVDLFVHRYGIYPDHVRAFMASGSKAPGLMGGQRESPVRHWPREFPVSDLHQADVLTGCYDVPYILEPGKEFVIVDIGADVGAFARWAAKRWPKCPIHSYEWRSELIGPLQTTATAIGERYGLKPTVYAGPVRAQDVEGFPVAPVVKIDAPGSERELVQALQVLGRLEGIDCLMVKYADELTAYFLRTILNPTHMTHCHQRFTENTGILKFLRRGS